MQGIGPTGPEQKTRSLQYLPPFGQHLQFHLHPAGGARSNIQHVYWLQCTNTARQQVSHIKTRKGQLMTPYSKSHWCLYVWITSYQNTDSYWEYRGKTHQGDLHDIPACLHQACLLFQKKSTEYNKDLKIVLFCSGGRKRAIDLKGCQSDATQHQHKL